MKFRRGIFYNTADAGKAYKEQGNQRASPAGDPWRKVRRGQKAAERAPADAPLFGRAGDSPRRPQGTNRQEARRAPPWLRHVPRRPCQDEGRAEVRDDSARRILSVLPTNMPRDIRRGQGSRLVYPLRRTRVGQHA